MTQSQLSATSLREKCRCVCHPLAAAEHGTAGV